MSLADDFVQRIFDELLAKRDVDDNTHLLATCGEEAVPVLLEQLASADFARKKVALFGLQYCFAPEARVPVEALLTGDDPRLREMAAIVIAKHYGTAEIARLARKLQHDPRPEIAGFALQHLEAQGPEFERVERALGDPRIAAWLWKYLPRYAAPSFTPGTRALLERSLDSERLEPEIACGALAALLSQNDRSDATRSRLRTLLAHEHPMLREMAAEFLAWHGSEEDAGALQEAAGDESDLQARAALAAASESIARRAASGDRKAFDAFVRIEEMEPFWNYRGKAPEPAFLAAQEHKLELLARAFAVPGRVPPDPHVFSGEFSAPVAKKLVMPVRGYLDRGRTSFALLSDSQNTGFRGMVHVGDDVAWFRDYGCVAAVADGLVRQAGSEPSWGYLVVLEHASPGDDRFCSVYAHLSPFISVRPGETVRAGQRIGSIGRSFTWENGGYAAHLHFGLHHGPFVQVHKEGASIDVRFEGSYYVGKVIHSDPENTDVRIQTWYGPRTVTQQTSWLRGYVSLRQWQAGRHRWLDPQKVFLDNQ